MRRIWHFQFLVIAVLGAVETTSVGAQSRTWRDGYDIQVQPEVTICTLAITPNYLRGEARWEERAAFAAGVAEAKRRGLSPAYCVALLRGDPLPSSGAPSPSVAAVAPSVPVADPLVVAIQTLLGVLGYDAGPADGMAGPKTTAAIAEFQRRAGEKSDGKPSEAVRVRLQSALAERAPARAPISPPPSTGQTREAKPISSGSGFYIGSDIIITNQHVVDQCPEIRVRKNGVEIGAARVLAANRGDDLAALRADNSNPKYLAMRIGEPLRPAEQVLVFGYPLSGSLSSSGNTTLGHVTALTGLKDDSRYIQMSASVQPGNSGGPVMDAAGRLVGVVVGKLDAIRVARNTGDIPQNVNFAIRTSALANFLEANRIAYEVATTAAQMPMTAVAERAEAASVLLECRK